MSRQALGRMPKGRRGFLKRAPVVARYYALSAELEGRLVRMRNEAHLQGLRDNPPVTGDSGQEQQGPDDHKPVDKGLSTRPTHQDVSMGDRVSAALTEAEIDRLKSEIRRANRTIDALTNTVDSLRPLVDSARPAEDTGLDEILPGPAQHRD